MHTTKKLVFTALCIAAGIALPLAFHQIPNAGMIFLPMHLPILLCGLICGWQAGFVCGIVTPLLSSLLTSMPPMAKLPGMLCELAVYGLVAGILIQTIKTKSTVANLYLSLIGAMVCGRLVSGLVNALFFSAGAYSLQAWLTTSFITALPGIAAQLVVLPALVLLLKKAKLIN